jgi:DNA-binding NarL/FixJ family response regulator
MARTTVLVVDDHPLFRDALQLAISKAAPEAEIIEAGSLAEAMDIARSDRDLDLVLLDLMMPDNRGFAGLAALHAERPQTPIIVVSAADPASVAGRARAYGAIGFVSKAAKLEDIAQAVRQGLDGASRLAAEAPAPVSSGADTDISRRIASLTPAQLKVMLGLLEGRLNKQIAFDMAISEATVKAHMTAVFRKLNVRNRTQAVLAARALGLEAAELV